jgi:hypothetical protein
MNVCIPFLDTGAIVTAETRRRGEAVAKEDGGLKMEDSPRPTKSSFLHLRLFLRWILCCTNRPTWKSALRASGAPVSKPAWPQEAAGPMEIHLELLDLSIFRGRLFSSHLPSSILHPLRCPLRVSASPRFYSCSPYE